VRDGGESTGPVFGHGAIESVNAGKPETYHWRGEEISTAIWKRPVIGRVPVRGVNLVGDDQADRRVHGGVDKAVYAYSREDLEWWSGELGRDLESGIFGENLTVRGISTSSAIAGERWGIGSALLEVCQPRIPCYKLGFRMDDPYFPKWFGEAERPGAYLRILKEGDVAAGDEIEIIHRPNHAVTVADVSRIYLRDHDEAYRLLEAPELAGHWHVWARKRCPNR
jgi:MOSC domain-containing protein YiiM